MDYYIIVKRYCGIVSFCHCCNHDNCIYKQVTIEFFVVVDGRVRGRVCTFLKNKFKTMDAAEQSYNLSLTGCLEELSHVGHSRKKSLAKNPESTHSQSVSTPVPVSNDDSFQLSDIPHDLREAIMKCLKKGISTLSDFITELLTCITDVNITNSVANFVFMELVKFHHIDTNPADFISRSLAAMKLLQISGKGNLLYKLAYCLTEKRQGTETPLLHLDRMPFGLLEYQLEFFSCTNIMQVTHLLNYLNCSTSFLRFIHLLVINK